MNNFSQVHITQTHLSVSQHIPLVSYKKLTLKVVKTHKFTIDFTIICGVTRKNHAFIWKVL